MRLRRVRRLVGFTLIELLVVVGIIAILVALIMPVLSRAREHANKIKCADNLRSIGQALTMYTQQYRYYPGAWFIDFQQSSPNTTVVSYAAAWPVRLRPFMGQSKDVFFCPSQDGQCRWTDTGPSPVSRANARFAACGYDPGEPLIHYFAPFSYGYNGSGTGDIGRIADGSHKGLGLSVGFRSDDPPELRMMGGELPASRVRVPADMIAVTDSTVDSRADYYSRATDLSTSLYPGQIHSGGANVLFCDGHVNWYMQRDLVIGSDAISNPSEWPKIRMWNNDHRTSYAGAGG
jgi:prepilin-type processing-associated H-X9-DG protein/prepilin-type N-terminal cleavage/methylation domain-containing protein